MPAFEMVTRPCSRASCNAVRSASVILSNSSIATRPRSASTTAPASSRRSPVSMSVVTAAVRPTPLLPRPVVETARGATCSTYLKQQTCMNKVHITLQIRKETQRMKSQWKKNEDKKKEELCAIANRSICDFATDGSPTRRMLISPRIRPPSESERSTPPRSWQRSALLIISWPWIEGAIEFANNGNSPLNYMIINNGTKTIRKEK